MLGAAATTSVMFNALVPTIAGANGESVTELDDEADAIEDVVGTAADELHAESAEDVTFERTGSTEGDETESVTEGASAIEGMMVTTADELETEGLKAAADCAVEVACEWTAPTEEDGTESAAAGASETLFKQASSAPPPGRDALLPMMTDAMSRDGAMTAQIHKRGDKKVTHYS
jgi:hypothetical protein